MSNKGVFVLPATGIRVDGNCLPLSTCNLSEFQMTFPAMKDYDLARIGHLCFDEDIKPDGGHRADGG